MAVDPLLNCTTPFYNELYGKWLENAGDLLNLASYQPGMKLMDLCGGTGAVSEAALSRGAQASEITLVDLNPRNKHWPPIQQHAVKAERVHLLIHDWSTFDVIVCRQAIAYLDIEQVAQSTWALLKPGGRFVFNTFNQPKWAYKAYAHKERDYVEASAYVGRHVFHVQAAWRRNTFLGWDLTKFYWHQDPEILTAFAKFDLHTERSAKGTRWICTKPA